MKARRMPNLWESSDDLSSRLSGGYFLYDGRVVYIEYSGDQMLNLHNPPDSKLLGKVSSKDEKLDVSSLELGYLNVVTSAGVKVFYLSRRTSKRYNQGVTRQSTSVSTISGGVGEVGYPDPKGRMAYVVGSQGFVDSVEGRFPPVRAISEYPEIALSQSVAVETLPTGLSLVYYRMKQVGHFDKKDDRVKIIEGIRGEFVREELKALGFNTHE